MRLHDWAVGARSWREAHGHSGGEDNVNSDVSAEMMDGVGAFVMGRNMFGGGPGPWSPDWQGWWGEDPPFHGPVFVLTHHEREPLAMKGGTTFTFVTDGIESALEQAKAAADGGDVLISGGASTVQQYLNASAVDEFIVHVAPVLLGSGTRLFDNIAPGSVELVRVIDGPGVTHLSYRTVG
jgi:dihydrofolate reductase